MKHCTKCNTPKPFTDFNKCKGKKDGLQSYCKKCVSETSRKWRRENPGKKRETARKWRSENLVRERENRRKWRRENADKKRETARKWESANKDKIAAYQAKIPEKIRARYTLCNAVRSGKIHRPRNCSVCGRIGRIEAHHTDYSRPLQVIWVCHTCHKIHFHGNRIMWLDLLEPPEL